MRLECLSTFDAYRKVGYSPSNRALRETRLASSRNDPEVGIGSRYTLKLLVVSVLPDRSVLLACDFLSVADRLRGGRRELKAEFLSSDRQTFDPILSESLFVSLRTLIHVRLPPPEQPVNYDGQFSGSGKYRRISSDPSRDLAIVRP